MIGFEGFAKFHFCNVYFSRHSAKWSKYGNHDPCKTYDLDFEKLFLDFDGNAELMKGSKSIFILSQCHFFYFHVRLLARLSIGYV